MIFMVLMLDLFVFIQVEFECINEKKRQKKKNYKNSGIVSVKHCEVSDVFWYYSVSECSGITAVTRYAFTLKL